MLSMGKIFLRAVSMRYTEYAKQLSPKLGIPVDILTGFIFIFVRATVHYAMFEDEYYLKAEMEALKLSVISVLSLKIKLKGGEFYENQKMVKYNYGNVHIYVFDNVYACIGGCSRMDILP